MWRGACRKTAVSLWLREIWPLNVSVVYMKIHVITDAIRLRTNLPLNIAMVLPLDSCLACCCCGCCCCCCYFCYFAFVTIKTIHINMTHHKICSPSATFHLLWTIAWITGQSFFPLSFVRIKWVRVKISMDHSEPKEHIREAYNKKKRIVSSREPLLQATINDFRAHHLYTHRCKFLCRKFNLFVFATATRIF